MHPILQALLASVLALVAALPAAAQAPAKKLIRIHTAGPADLGVRKAAPEREAESLAAVKKLGMKVVDIDVGPLQKAAVTAQDDLAKDFGAEALLAQIRKQ